MKDYDYGVFGEFEGEQVSVVANAKKYTKKETIVFFKSAVKDEEIDLFDGDGNELSEEQIEIVLESLDENNVEETYICTSKDDSDYDWIPCSKEEKDSIKCWEIDKEKINIDDIIFWEQDNE